MKILVSGGTGMVGRSLVPRLAQSHEVHALTRRQAPADVRAEVSWIRHDLTQPLESATLPGSVDAVIHLAQSQRYRDFPDGAEDIFEVNVHSTFRLLEYARRAGASKFVLASTGGLYRPDPSPITESAPVELIGPYFRSKRIAELLLEDYEDLLTGIALRFFFVYGPGEGQTLVPRLARRILAGDEITVEGDPGLKINPLFVEDAASSIEAAVALDEPAVVNVAGDETVTITELVERLAAALDREPRVRHVSASGAGDMVADTSRMSELLRVRPGTNLDLGLRAVADSVRQLA
jgi:UDP-glucose 4-epimerase